jgi:hypothetical protein
MATPGRRWWRIPAGGEGGLHRIDQCRAEIREATAGQGKALTLELGGKSPYIVFDDADLDSAVEGLVDAIWFNQGQVCCAGSRLLVQEGVAERFHDKLKRRMDGLRWAIRWTNASTWAPSSIRCNWTPSPAGRRQRGRNLSRRGAPAHRAASTRRR